LPAAPALLPLSGSQGPGTGPGLWSRGGFPGAPPGGQAATPPRGSRPRPTFTTPRDGAPRWTGRVQPRVNSPKAQEENDDVNIFSVFLRLHRALNAFFLPTPRHGPDGRRRKGTSFALLSIPALAAIAQRAPIVL